MSEKQKTTPSASTEWHSLMERRTFLSLLLVISLVFLFLLKPFFSAIFWACVLGILFYPLQLKLLNTWQKPNLASLATLGVALLVGILPVLFIFVSFVQEGSLLYQDIQSGRFNLAEYVERIRQAFPLVQEVLKNLNIDFALIKEQLSNLAVNMSRYLAQNAVSFGQNTLEFFMTLVLTLYLAFFMLRDGPDLINLMIRALPLGDERERMLFNKFAEVTRATVKGNLMVACVQGALGGMIFWFLAIPAPLLWGVVMTFMSLIPVAGAGLIWGPVALYLLAIGDWSAALTLFAFGAGVIGLVDNLLRPVLVGRDMRLPDFMVLLSTLGGFVLFGMQGFVIGPLIAALFVAFWQIFILEFN